MSSTKLPSPIEDMTQYANRLSTQIQSTKINLFKLQTIVLQSRPTTSRFDKILLLQEAAILGVLGGVIRCLSSSLGGARHDRARRVTTVSRDPRSRDEDRQLPLARSFYGLLRPKVSRLHW